MEIFKKGDLVLCTRNAVLVTGKSNNKAYPSFSGVVVMAIKGDDKPWPVGMWSDTWNTAVFKKTKINLSKLIRSEIKEIYKQ